MKESLKEYVRSVDKIINSKRGDIDFKSIIHKHVIKINIYQHERLVHLLVTLSFAIMTILVFLFSVNSFNLGLFLLLMFFIMLLIPYVFYYYFLENNVQRLYDQYDKLIEKEKDSTY